MIKTTDSRKPSTQNKPTCTFLELGHQKWWITTPVESLGVNNITEQPSLISQSFSKMFSKFVEKVSQLSQKSQLSQWIKFPIGSIGTHFLLGQLEQLGHFFYWDNWDTFPIGTLPKCIGRLNK